MLPKMTTLLKRRDEIVDTDDCSPEKADLKRRIDKWDEEHVQLEKAAEKGCRKKKVGRIPYTPEVGEWVKRRNVLIRLEKYHASREQQTRSKTKMKSLKDACISAHIPMPECTTLDTVQLELHICRTKLKELEKNAAKVRKNSC